MAEPMDIDLSLDEIIARKRAQARTQAQTNHYRGNNNNNSNNNNNTNNRNGNSNSNSRSRSSRNRNRYNSNGNGNSNSNRKNRSSFNSNRDKEQITRMNIDLSLDELIAKRKTNGQSTNQSQTNFKPYPRRGFGSHHRPGSYYRPSYSNPHPSSRPVPRAPIQNLGPRSPSRFITIAPFTRDVSPAQIRDMMQEEVGPVQNVTMTLKGEAHVLFKGMRGWAAYDRFHGQYLDGVSRLYVKPYPIIPPYHPKNFTQALRQN